MDWDKARAALDLAFIGQAGPDEWRTLYEALAAGPALEEAGSDVAMLLYEAVHLKGTLDLTDMGTLESRAVPAMTRWQSIRAT